MTKRDAKRQAILDTAYRLFREKGFEATSVSEITALVGGSKATIYSHFASKEELFMECVMAAAEEYITGVLPRMEALGSEPGVVLWDLGIHLLEYICSSDIMAVRRLLIAEGNRSGIGKLFYAKINTLRTHVAQFLYRYMEAGILRPEDPMLAATHFRALLEAELVEPLLLHVQQDPPQRQEIELAVDRAVAAFLRAYATDRD